MSGSTSKTEYVVTYYWKDGFTNKITSDNYGSLLWEASEEFKHNMNVIDYYEITEVTTITKVVKSSKE